MKLPLFSDKHELFDVDTRFIASVAENGVVTRERYDDLAFIAHAVNHHERLVNALRSAIEIIGPCQNDEATVLDQEIRHLQTGLAAADLGEQS